MNKQNIRIHLRAYDNKILDLSTIEIVNTANTISTRIQIDFFIYFVFSLMIDYFSKTVRKRFEYMQESYYSIIIEPYVTKI